MTVFNLPDLGEGLPDAEIVKWWVAEGDEVEVDQILGEITTAKATVELPSPHKGRIVKFHGGPGDVIETGQPLITFALEGETVSETGARPAAAAPRPKTEPRIEQIEEDEGLVVGQILVSDKIVAETSTSREGVTANAAVRALARKLKVDLNTVQGSGADGAITLADVRTAATAAPAAREPTVAAAEAIKIGPAARATAQALGLDIAAIAATGPKGVVTKEDVLAVARELTVREVPSVAAGTGVRAVPRVRAHAQRSGVDIATIAPSGLLGNITIADVDRAIQGAATAAEPQAIVPLQAYRRPERGREVTGQPERVVGPRRVMAQLMAKSHAEVAATTIFDEADVTGWPEGSDITMRIVRAIVAACRVEPALNAWFDGEALEKTHHREVHLGVAVDAASGLFVPVLRDVDTRSPGDIRADLDRLRALIADNKITAREMRGATITLSNYGMIAGRFATPVISPPEVAIVGIGGLYHQLALTARGIENRRLMPVSLTFDHRACTGGDTARFLAALLQDLSLNH